MASEKKLKKDNWNVYNCYRHLLRFSPGLFRETSFLLSFWQQAFNTAKATFSDPFNIMIQASFSSMKGLLPFKFVHMLRNCCRNFLATILQDSTGISAAENLHQIMSILGRTFLWKSKHKIKKKSEKNPKKKHTIVLTCPSHGNASVPHVIDSSGHIRHDLAGGELYGEHWGTRNSLPCGFQRKGVWCFFFFHSM